MESTHSIQITFWEGDWAVSLDLTDTYYHIPIAPSSRKYFRFVVNDKEQRIFTM